jgi:hypothetical protein
MLKVTSGEQKMGGTQVFEWFFKFETRVPSSENSDTWNIH